MLKHWVAIGGLAMAAPALAGDDVGQWYINPQLGYVITDHSRGLDNDWLYGLGIGYNVAQHFGLEVNANTARLSPTTGGGAALDLNAVALDGLFYFTRRPAVAPYLLLGAGVIQDDPKFAAPSHDNVMVEGGLGLRAQLWQSADASKSFSLRPEAKVRYDDIKLGHFTDYIGTLGFQFGFGAPRHTVERVAEAAPPPPAPAPEPTPPPPPPQPMDSDHDGVPDDRDQCPNTPAGTLVDENGCPRKGSIVLQGVTFEFNSSTLTTASRPVLDTTAEGLKKHPRVRVEIQGHTDSKGKRLYNQKLSQRRAEAVRSYLIDQGVPDGQLSAKGYGATKPVADNATEEGRGKNRRVVMEVLDNPGDVQVKGEGTAKETAQ